MNAKWRSIANFPVSTGEWSIMIAPLRFKLPGRERVEASIKTALPLNPVLLSTPSTNCRYLPPILAAADSGLMERIARNSRISALMAIAAWVIGTLVSIALGQYEFAVIFGVALGAVAAQSTHSWLISRTQELLTERWLFYGWCSVNGAKYGFAFLALMLFAGAGQLALGRIMGSSAEVLEQLGLIYQAPWSGELWRLFSAPLLHINLAHWILNTVIGTAVLLLAGPLFGSGRVSIVFLVSSVMGLGSVSLLDPIVAWQSYGIVGASGGISGCMGLIIVSALRFPSHFPKEFAVTLTLTGFVLLISSSVFVNVTGTLAHTVGIAVGIGFGLCLTGLSEEFVKIESDSKPKVDSVEARTKT